MNLFLAILFTSREFYRNLLEEVAEEILYSNFKSNLTFYFLLQADSITHRLIKSWILNKNSMFSGWIQSVFNNQYAFIYRVMSRFLKFA